MENLKQLMDSTNHPSILSQMPQIQLICEELGSMIQTLFVDEERDLHELEKVRNPKNRFKDIIDLFVSGVNFKSPKVEFAVIIVNMKMDPLGMKKKLEEIIVGLDGDAEMILEKLTEDQKQLNLVSIVGMGGLGNITPATKVFNDGYVVYHFHVQKRDLLIEILSPIGIKLDPEKDSDSRLREMLHKRLTGRRYSIVIDDTWSNEAWDELRLFFPNDNTRSRILLAGRLKEVALHAKSHGLVHRLRYLTEWLIEPGMQIARNHHGSLLAVVVIAGVLAKEATSKDSWERIAEDYLMELVDRNLELFADRKFNGGVKARKFMPENMPETPYIHE